MALLLGLLALLGVVDLAVIDCNYKQPNFDRIPSLVLTYGKRLPITRLMIDQYNVLWPEHPFQFFVPTQDPNMTDEEIGLHTTAIYAPDSRIPSTMFRLLDCATDPNDVIYFAIDDNFPVKLNTTLFDRAVKKVYELTFHNDTFGGLFLSCFREPKVKKCSRGQSLELVHVVETKNNFWSHHFTRAWYIRAFYTFIAGSKIRTAKDYDKYKDQAILAIARPPIHNTTDGTEYYLYASHETLVIEESSHRGKITTLTLEIIQSRGFLDNQSLHDMFLPAVNFTIQIPAVSS